MVTVYDVPVNAVIDKAAAKFKEDKVDVPAYVRLVKTGPHKDRVPESPDYWYHRLASLLYQAYRHERVGVARLRTHYGGRQNRGVRPEHHKDAAGSQIRRGLQQLEKLGFVKKEKKGRVITAAGKKLLDGMARQVASAKPKE